MVCTAATFTPERARQFDYGRAYLDMALGGVVRDEEPDGGDVRGGRFAVRSATTAERCIYERLEPAEVLTFEYNADTYEALLDGRADAVVDDSPIAAWFVGRLDGLPTLHSLPSTDLTMRWCSPKGARRAFPSTPRSTASTPPERWTAGNGGGSKPREHSGQRIADEDGPRRALLLILDRVLVLDGFA